MKFSNLLQRGISVLPVPVLRRIELGVMLALGKGWGASTVTQEVEAAKSLLTSDIKQNLVAMDIGAHVGDWTAALVSSVSDAVVYCFEPSSTAFAVLTQRFSGHERVRVIKSAVGDKSGVAQLWFNEPGSYLASLSRRRLDHFDIDFFQYEEVPVITLNSFLVDNSVAPHLLKIDVEGHELAVLKGSTKMMQSVEVVQFEFGGTNIDTRTYFQDFFYYFKELGFRLFRLGPKGLELIDYYSEADEAFMTTNFFAQRVR